jgi:hypothetical protein
MDEKELHHPLIQKESIKIEFLKIHLFQVFVWYMNG